MIRRLFRSQSGTAMVEFAIVAPVLIFLMIGLVEVGRYMYFGILAQHAAEAAAQYGSQSITTANDTTGMQTAASTDAGGVTWTITPSCTVGTSVVTCPSSATISSGTTYYVTVKVTATFSSLLNYPGIPTRVPVTGSSTMRVLVE